LSALRALDRDFDALADASGLRGGDGREAVVLGLLAGLAALGLVLQTLVVEKDLLASRPSEILTAIDAAYRTVVELRLDLIPLSIGFCDGFYCVYL
jgi:hypothetical protein